MTTTASTILKLSNLVLIPVSLLVSCSSAEEKVIMEEQAKAYADSVSSVIQKVPQSQVPIKNDSLRAFVRTADLYFKVKDVKMATFDIENIVREHQGYVTSSKLESTANYKNSVRVSKDSVMDLINYTVHNDIILRVPNVELDKTLNEIASLMDYLEYRKIKADDVTKQFQSAKLSESRFTEHKKRVESEIDKNNKKLNQTMDAENDLLVKQEMADMTKVSTMELAHDVAFSTVKISIYQRETTKKEIYAYITPMQPYEPPFFEKFGTSLSTGATIFAEIILFFVKLWPIAVFGLIIVFIIRFIFKHKKVV